MTTLMLCIGRKNPMLYRPIGLPSLPVSCAVDAYRAVKPTRVRGGLPGHWSAASPLEWCKPQLLPPLLYPPMAVPADGCIVAFNSFEVPASVPPQSRSPRKLRFLVPSWVCVCLPLFALRRTGKILRGTELGVGSIALPRTGNKFFENVFGTKLGLRLPPVIAFSVECSLFPPPHWSEAQIAS